MIPPAVQAAARSGHPAYLYDLASLADHAATVRRALPAGVELLYAMKANPDPALLAALAPYVTGLEVASGGELAHHAASGATSPVAAFGGPGKTPEEIAAGIGGGVQRFHVESLRELLAVNQAARAVGRVLGVLLRVNIPTPPRAGAALVMGGAPSPFGMDPPEADACIPALADLPWVRFRGIHAHLASGLDAVAAAAVASDVVDWAMRFGARHGVPIGEVNVGGGMAVDYVDPQRRFDWAAYGGRLRRVLDTHPGLTLRIEPGRSLTVYCGWYATEVLDVKRSHGRWFAVVRGGTHHLRTPAAKGHNHPFTVLPVGAGPGNDHPPITVVGQLCTPRDVLSRAAPVRLSIGDVVVFCMAGAYAWNISHHDFLMHPPPAMRYLNVPEAVPGPGRADALPGGPSPT
ncbi:type III PLP-dependent enzyme [Micromonospora sp. HUAS LYJ1]|uniref:type III PLP-dependent enzyme n=1 Tax=Micromonospora sp. HUAS LYJ1 TaxID=3061626 RepID=UPI0026711F8C|nr:type III PLP-dependent enzyme [Micromonospora sp. HUAS LYJ1]WKU07132.1 type III PLP-dependent enzyme [Micromonospora sp. HUAS LYJ1]